MLMRGCSSSPIRLTHQNQPVPVAAAATTTRHTSNIHGRARRTWRAAATRSSHNSRSSITTCPATQCPLRGQHPPPAPPTLNPSKERKRAGERRKRRRPHRCGSTTESRPSAADRARHHDRSRPLPGWHFLPIDPGTFAQSTGGQRRAGRGKGGPPAPDPHPCRRVTMRHRNAGRQWRQPVCCCSVEMLRRAPAYETLCRHACRC